jgi:hypothetical protein
MSASAIFTHRSRSGLVELGDGPLLAAGLRDPLATLTIAVLWGTL